MQETAEYARNCSVLIAATENLKPAIQAADKLEIICRIGIGLDNVPLELCKERGIKVTYTPDAVSPAVWEFTVGLMLDLLRDITQTNSRMKSGQWIRIIGNRIAESTIGIVGVGRIGGGIISLLESFGPKKILIHDLLDKSDIISKHPHLKILQTGLDELLSRSDVVSFHVPCNKDSYRMLNADNIGLMKKSASLINTARGEVVEDGVLYNALKNGDIRNAAIDVYEEEPYNGILTELDNVVLTPHMASCSLDCRREMEMQATESAIAYMEEGKVIREVPAYSDDY